MRLLSLICLIAIGASLPARGADSCTGFKWDIGRERALFAGTDDTQTTGTSVAALPALRTDRLYRLTLAPQERVSFSVLPDKNSAGAHGGLATLRVAPGYYRIAVNAALWIDVVADGKLAPVTDYQGQVDCTAPRKIVVFDLTQGHEFMLQLSGATQDNVLLTVTRSATP